MKTFILKNDGEVNNILSLQKYAFIQMSSSWCGPCKSITPKVKELVSKINNEDWAYLYCDVDKIKGLADSLDVKSIPCFFIFSRKKGKIIDKLLGSNFNKLVDFLANYNLLQKPYF